MSVITKTRLLIVDDHAIVRRGLAMLLSRYPEFEVVAEASGRAEALEKLEGGQIDVAIIDLALKDGDGLGLIRDIREKWPKIPCLVLSMHDENEYAERALRAGASGYVMKENADESIVDALRAVLRGRLYFGPDVAARLMRRGAGARTEGEGIVTLTEREREIFRLLGQGLSSKKIADALGLSERTVEVHRSSIKRKLGCEDTAQMLRMAVRWVEQCGGGRPAPLKRATQED